MKRSLIFVILFVCLALAIYLGLTFAGAGRQRLRVQRDGAFIELGKRIASHIQTSSEIPQNLQELENANWLSSAERQFLRDNKVIYFPPATNGSQDQIILRMSYEGGLSLVVQRDGYMRKEGH